MADESLGLQVGVPVLSVAGIGSLGSRGEAPPLAMPDHLGRHPRDLGSFNDIHGFHSVFSWVMAVGCASTLALAAAVNAFGVDGFPKTSKVTKSRLMVWYLACTKGH
jgi:hypothetical protein